MRASTLFFTLGIGAVGCVGLGCHAHQQPSLAHDSERAGPITTTTPAPDFTVQTLDGKSFHLSEHAGKVVLLDFFTTEKQPCVQALATVQQLSEKHQKDGLVVLAVSIDPADGRANVRTFVDERHLTISVTHDQDGKLAGLYDRKSTAPYSVLIGRDGRLLKSRDGFEKGEEQSMATDVETALLAKP